MHKTSTGSDPTGVVWRFLPCVFATVGVCVCHSEVGFCVWVWVDLLGVVCAWRV